MKITTKSASLFCARAHSGALSQSATTPYLSLSWVMLRPGLKCSIFLFMAYVVIVNVQY